MATVMIILLCGCRAEIATSLVGAELLKCAKHCTAQPFVVDV